MQSTLVQVMSLLKCQQEEIAELRGEINRQNRGTSNIEDLQVQVDRMGKALETRITDTLSQHSEAESILYICL